MASFNSEVNPITTLFLSFLPVALGCTLKRQRFHRDAARSPVLDVRLLSSLSTLTVVIGAASGRAQGFAMAVVRICKRLAGRDGPSAPLGRALNYILKISLLFQYQQEHDANHYHPMPESHGSHRVNPPQLQG
jgi:hypothetical protein